MFKMISYALIVSKVPKLWKEQIYNQIFSPRLHEGKSEEENQLVLNRDY